MLCTAHSGPRSTALPTAQPGKTASASLLESALTLSSSGTLNTSSQQVGLHLCNYRIFLWKRNTGRFWQSQGGSKHLFWFLSRLILASACLHMSKRLFTVWVWQLSSGGHGGGTSFFVSLLDANLTHPNEKGLPVCFLGDQAGETSVVGSSLNASRGISIPGYVWGCGWRWGDGWGW